MKNAPLVKLGQGRRWRGDLGLQHADDYVTVPAWATHLAAGVAGAMVMGAVLMFLRWL